MVAGIDPQVIVAVAAPTLLLFITQLGMLIWFLASMKVQQASLQHGFDRIDHQTREHHDELKECNGRLIRLETLLDVGNKNGMEWRKSLEDKIGANSKLAWEWREKLDGRITRLESRPMPAATDD